MLGYEKERLIQRQACLTIFVVKRHVSVRVDTILLVVFIAFHSNEIKVYMTMILRDWFRLLSRKAIRAPVDGVITTSSAAIVANYCSTKSSQGSGYEWRTPGLHLPPQNDAGEVVQEVAIQSAQRSSRSLPDETTTKALPADKRSWLSTHEHHLPPSSQRQSLKCVARPLSDGPETEAKAGVESRVRFPLRSAKRFCDKAVGDLRKFRTDRRKLSARGYNIRTGTIGHGAFGVVKIAERTNPAGNAKQIVAIKSLRPLPKESEQKHQRRIASEYCIASSMHHINIVKTLDLLQDGSSCFHEVMEYCGGGDLFKLVDAVGQLAEVEADCFFKQIVRGVASLHENGVAHRDLKPENILLTRSGVVRIADFGNAEVFRLTMESKPTPAKRLCGSRPYISPEQYVDKEFDAAAVDVWACGIIYMVMRTGGLLWRVAKKGEDENYTQYLEDRKTEWGFRPIEVLRRRRCRNVVYSILDPNPNRRLNIDEVRRSEWIQSASVCSAAAQEADLVA